MGKNNHRKYNISRNNFWYSLCRSLELYDDTKNEEPGTGRKILVLINNDLDRKLRFIDESIQYKDYKPFFTDIWNAVILSGKQTLLPFEVIENLQHTYSWLKYYITELQQKTSTGNENIL